MKIKEKWVSWEELLPGFSPAIAIDFQQVGGMAPGSIPFAGATGFLTQDNANLFWDETNARLGIGTSAPAADCALHIEFPADAVVISRLGAKTRPWRQWECIDGNWGLAIGIHADDGRIHFNYDTPIGTLDTSMIVFDGPNKRVGIQDPNPTFAFDVGVSTRINDAFRVTGAVTFTDILGVTGDTTLSKVIVTGDGEDAINLTGTAGQIHFTGGAGEKGIGYKDTGGDQRYAIRFPNASDVVELLNRASNGTVEIHANTAVAGVAGDVLVAEFQDDIINFFVGLNITGILTLENEGLHLLDTGGDHDLIIKPGEDFLADRILTIVMGDAARTITLSGDPTLDDWFDQTVKQASSPSFAGVYIKNGGELRFYDNGNYVGFEAPALGADQIWILPDADGGVGEFLQTDGAGNLTWAAGGGAATFLALTDTPGAYAPHGLETLRVNFAEDAIEFYVQEDQYVKVDGGAASGYLGIAAGDGVLRTAANITVADGGNFITLDTVQDIGTGDSPTFAGLTVTDILFYDLVDYNFVYGSGSGLNLTGGSAKTNVLMGFECGKEVTTGDYNVAFGHQALWRNQTGSNNVAIGYRALYGTVGQHGTKNTAIGYKALQSAYGTGNYGLGSDAGVGITSGTYNVCIGQSAGGGISVGHQNVAIGGYCMGNASGSYNTCVGPYSGRMLTGLYNVAFGREAIRYGTSVQNSVAIGRMASYRNVEGDENVMVGYQCGYGSGAGVDYHDNVGVGAYALWGIGEQGNKNIAIGWEAGYSISTGQGNVCIGYRAGKTNLTTDSNELWIANSDTATPLIYGEFDTPLLKVTGEFDVVGASKLGDGGVANHANIAADGTVTLTGTARVTKRIFLNNAAFTKGATAPVQVILGNLNGWEFDINDDAVMTIMMPDDWDSTTNLTIKVCWYIDEAYAADKEIQWRIDWSALPHDFTEAVDAPTHSGQIDSGDIDIPAVAKRMGASTIGTIVAANLSAGDMLGFTLSRIAVTHDDPSAKPTIHHLIIEYTSNKIGT